MDLPLHNAGPNSRGARGLLRLGLAVLVASAVWLGTLAFPLQPVVGLDASWQMVINRAWTEGFIYGRDVVYTYGPWGWLSSQYYDASVFRDRLLWEFLFKAIAAGLIAAAVIQLNWPRRIGLIAAGLLLTALFHDTLPMLLIAGLVVWAGRFRPHVAVLGASGALLGFLALQKVTYLVMVAGGVGCAGAQLALDRQWRPAGCLAGSTLVGFLAGWIAAGQPLGALPDFLRSAAWITSGYSEAMFMDESMTVFAFGLATAGLFIVLVWDAPRWTSLPLALAMTGFGFMSWKHGFVRADGHTLGFFVYMVFAGLVAPWINPVATWRRCTVSWLLCAVAVAGAAVAQRDLMSVLPRLAGDHVAASVRTLADLPGLRRQLDGATAALATEVDLPAVRARIGSASIDQFGYEQAVVLLNRFNYRPRPVFQSYQAYSGPLAALNEAAYLSPDGPAYTLVRLQSIDWRYPALEDSPLLAQLIIHHSPVLSEKGFLLLKRNPTPGPLVRQPVTAGRLRYGIEECPLPVDGRAAWVTLDAPLSWLGWLRTFLYKTPEVSLFLRNAAGDEERFRLIVPAARAGFLLSPYLNDTQDLERLVSQRIGRPVHSFRLEIRPADRIYFLKRARYEISLLPELKYHPPAAPATASP